MTEKNKLLPLVTFLIDCMFGEDRKKQAFALPS